MVPQEDSVSPNIRIMGSSPTLGAEITKYIYVQCVCMYVYMVCIYFGHIRSFGEQVAPKGS